MTTTAATFDDVFKKRIDKIEADAREIGLNFTSICKKAGISRATPDRWRRDIPKTIKIIAKMEEVIAEHRASLPPLPPR